MLADFLGFFEFGSGAEIFLIQDIIKPFWFRISRILSLTLQGHAY